MAIDPNNLAGTATLTFADEFNDLSLRINGSGTWDTNDAWSPANGHTIASNGEKQWYINAEYAPTQSVTPWTVSNGVLDITAQNTPANIKPLIDGYDYTSGMLTTQHSFSQQYGYFEIRAELPEGDGLWPAFWLLNAKGGWPPELDVMEQLGQDPNTYYSTVHSQASGQHTMDGTATSVPDVTAGFHKYGVDWQADDITFYFDGKPIYETSTPADMHDPMYMLVNLAVGGYWPGDPVADPNFKETMHVDYVRVYSDNPDATPAPASDMPQASPSEPSAGAADPVVAAPGSADPVPVPAAPEPAPDPIVAAPGAVDPAPTPDPAPAQPADSAPSTDTAGQPETPVLADGSQDPAPAAPAPAAEPAPVVSADNDAPPPQEAASSADPETPDPTAEQASGDMFNFDHVGGHRGGCGRGSQSQQASDFADTLDWQSFSHGSGGWGDHSGRHGSRASQETQVAALDDAQDFQFDVTSGGHGRHGDHHHHNWHDWTV